MKSDSKSSSWSIKSMSAAAGESEAELAPVTPDSGLRSLIPPPFKLYGENEK